MKSYLETDPVKGRLKEAENPLIVNSFPNLRYSGHQYGAVNGGDRHDIWNHRPDWLLYWFLQGAAYPMGIRFPAAFIKGFHQEQQAVKI